MYQVEVFVPLIGFFYHPEKPVWPDFQILLNNVQILKTIEDIFTNQNPIVHYIQTLLVNGQPFFQMQNPVNNICYNSLMGVP